MRDGLEDQAHMKSWRYKLKDMCSLWYISSVLQSWYIANIILRGLPRIWPHVWSFVGLPLKHIWWSKVARTNHAEGDSGLEKWRIEEQANQGASRCPMCHKNRKMHLLQRWPPIIRHPVGLNLSQEWTLADTGGSLLVWLLVIIFGHCNLHLGLHILCQL